LRILPNVRLDLEAQNPHLTTLPASVLLVSGSVTGKREKGCRKPMAISKENRIISYFLLLTKLKIYYTSSKCFGGWFGTRIWNKSKLLLLGVFLGKNAVCYKSGTGSATNACGKAISGQ